MDEILEPLIRRASVLEVKRAAAPLSLVVSKFGGVPYQEAGESWPVCPTCKKCLSFICQFDLRQTNHPMQHQFPFWTFFYCWNCFPFGSPEDPQGQWVARRYRQVSEARAVTSSIPTDAEQTTECEVTFRERLSLPSWGGAQAFGVTISNYGQREDGREVWEVYEDNVTRIAGEQSIATLIGGYPHWIQGDDTPENSELLIQIDSEHEAGIMWGDVGCVYLFLTNDPNPQVRMVFQCC